MIAFLLGLSIAWSLFLHVVTQGSLYCKNAEYCLDLDSKPEVTDVFSLSVSCSREWLVVTVSKLKEDADLSYVIIDYNCTTPYNSTIDFLQYRFTSQKGSYTFDPVYVGPPADEGFTCYLGTCTLDPYCGMLLFEDAPTECSTLEVLPQPLMPSVSSIDLNSPSVTYDSISSSILLYDQLPSSSFLTPSFDMLTYTTSSSVYSSSSSSNAQQATPHSYYTTSLMTTAPSNSVPTDSSSTLSPSGVPFTVPEITYVIVPMGLVVIAALGVSLLCVLVIQRNIRNKSTEEIMMEFIEDPGGSTSRYVFQDSTMDHMSYTESVVTLEAPLEVNLHSGVDSRVSMATPVHYSVSSNTVSSMENCEQKTNQANEQFVDLSRPTMDAPSSCSRHCMTSSLSNTSPIDSNECTSLNSYLDTTTITYPTTTDTSSPLHCPVHIAEPHPLESTVIPYDNISLESCEPYSDDDGYNQSAVGSEGYVTEPPNSADYIEQLSPSCYHHNAQVNDYVLQKKINNSFIYQSSPSSSGYQSSAATDYISLPS